MRVQLRRIRIAFSLIVLLSIFEFCMSNNDTWTRNRDRKIRVIEKLKKDFRKLKKQEGALKLIGGENGDYEGATFNYFYIRNLTLEKLKNKMTTKNIKEKINLQFILSIINNK